MLLLLIVFLADTLLSLLLRLSISWCKKKESLCYCVSLTAVNFRFYRFLANAYARFWFVHCYQGLSLLTLSALLSTHTATDLPCSPPPFQLILFFFALYLVAIGESGHKPCAQAFGADQFDGHDPQESKAKSSFFNWWYCCKSGGTMVTLLILNYIQDNLNWGLGFGIPCAAMLISLVIFLLGSKMYRYSVKVDKKSAFLRIGSVFMSSIRNWRTTPSAIALEEEARGTRPHPSSEQHM